ncbi:beta-amyrin 28-oxidase-like [Quillaja saponaria]|uniref:Beta-amyrin 28-oxidase-like n=1 Tax=Quillaja saponaria TaxID=32244 RepID=A0AAD7Q5Y5_QUISA|nr:beta-amyrin 28-oxidase-like [Quillaja saponaria]
MGFLKPERLLKYMGKIESITQQHIRTQWESQEEVHVFVFVKTFMLNLSFQIFFDLNDPERISKLASKFAFLQFGVQSVPVNIPGTTYYRAHKAAEQIRKEIQLIIREKCDALSKGAVMEDILADIIVAEQAGRYMSNNIAAYNLIMGLMLANNVSVSNVITYMIKHIGERAN